MRQINLGFNILAAAALAAGIVWIGKSVSDRKTVAINPLELNQNALATGKAPSIDWDVISIHDGDTMQVKRGNQKLKVRFACIDAPELKQPLGIQSRDYLRELVKNSRGKVGLDIISKDRYGRSVAEVWVSQSHGGGEPSPELVQSLESSAGMVYPYEKYKSDCNSWDAVQSTSNQAQSKRLGVWSGDYQKPWDYRRSSR